MTVERNMIEFLAVSYCGSCHKLSYATRKTARRATNWYTSHKTAYRCPVGNVWHVGQLPNAVVNGSMDRKEYYGSRSKAS